jgi:putative endonuclease
MKRFAKQPSTANMSTNTKIEGNRGIGQAFEQMAEDYLRAQGLTQVMRNYTCKMGEIDLIMQDKNCLVFVEVRHRKNILYGSPLETVSKTKQHKIQNTAQHYLQAHKISTKQALRFDVVGIVGKGDDIQWIANAF